jgi:hypothetical protein
MRQRHETVEHPFGTLKMRMGATHFLMKRLPKVATEMATTRARLQSNPRDEHHGHRAALGSDEGIASTSPTRRATNRPSPATGRFHTTGLSASP